MLCEPPSKPSKPSTRTRFQIATLAGNLRELDAQAEVVSLKQQIADAQLKTVLAQLEVGKRRGNRP